MDFAFAFASLPAAGSTLVFARPYRPSEAQTTLMNASLALGKLLGFPLLFVSAVAHFDGTSRGLMIMIHEEPAEAHMIPACH